MPFRSRAQQRWAYTPAGEKALGGPAKVKEWADATNYSKLPERVQHLAEGGLVEKDSEMEHPPDLANFFELW